MSALSGVVAMLTERLLLLLGWDKIKPLRESVYNGNPDSSYQELQKTNQNLRRRLQQTDSGEGERPTTASWEHNAPTLRPIAVVLPQPKTERASAWSSDGAAFDAAATGTV